MNSRIDDFASRSAWPRDERAARRGVSFREWRQDVDTDEGVVERVLREHAGEGPPQARAIESLGPAEQLHAAIRTIQMFLEAEQPIVLERAHARVDAQGQLVEDLVRGAGVGGNRERHRTRGEHGVEPHR